MIYKAVFVLLLGSISVHAGVKKKTYQCAFSDSKNFIHITTNSSDTGEINPNTFTIFTSGLFPEFDGMTSDLHVCNYGGNYKGESLKTGMHCTSIALAAGYDYKSEFTIRSKEANLGNNPKFFAAEILGRKKKYLLRCMPKN